MNDIHLTRIAELEDLYTRSEGIAQFSWYRFACFIIENEPALTEAIVEEALQRIGHQVGNPSNRQSQPTACQPARAKAARTSAVGEPRPLGRYAAKEKKMPKIRVEIEWDSPSDPFWLNPDNVCLALHAYCQNTHFKVRGLTPVAGDRAYCFGKDNESIPDGEVCPECGLPKPPRSTTQPFGSSQ